MDESMNSLSSSFFCNSSLKSEHKDLHLSEKLDGLDECDVMGS
jgi:hypothetical protein